MGLCWFSHHSDFASHGQSSLGEIPYLCFGLCNHTLCSGSKCLWIRFSVIVVLHAIIGHLLACSWMRDCSSAT